MIAIRRLISTCGDDGPVTRISIVAQGASGNDGPDSAARRGRQKLRCRPKADAPRDDIKPVVTRHAGRLKRREKCTMSATTKVKDVLTKGEVAKICNVAPRTVSK